LDGFLIILGQKSIFSTPRRKMPGQAGHLD